MIMINLIVRSVDFIYDVILSKYIGAEGLGLFQMARSVLMIFLVISTAGLPTAIARLVAEYRSKNNYASIRKILIVSILLALSFAAIFSLIIFIFAENIAVEAFKNDNLIAPIYFLIPSIILLPLTITLRGYYYGLNAIMVPSVSQIIEHVGQLLIVFGMLYMAYPMEPKLGATIAIWGIAIGEVLDLIWLTVMLRKSNKGPYNPISRKESGLNILKKIFSISAPIAVGDIVSVILGFANSIFIPRRLMAIGYTNSEAVSTLGRISGMAMPLISLPFIVTGAIAINLVPNLSENMALKRYSMVKHNIKFAIKMTLLVAIPVTGLFLFYSQPLGYFIYEDIHVGQFIKFMAYGTVFFALEHTFSGILNGLNKQVAATKNRLIGLTLQVFCIYSLVGHPKFGINGYFIGFFLSRWVIFLLDRISIKRRVKLKLDYGDLILKPIMATAIMLVVIYICKTVLVGIGFQGLIGLLISIVAGGLAYILVLFATGAIPRKLLERLLG